MCGACRNEKNHPNLSKLAANKREAAAELLTNNVRKLCTWKPGVLQAEVNQYLPPAPV
jgi:hypothetical protein